MNVLIITGLTLPEVSDDELARIAAAAGPDSHITVVRRPEEALPVASEVEVILGFVNPKLLASAPRLRWVHAIASGVDFFLFPEFRDSDIVLTSEKGLVGPHLADHAFGLLLSLTRQIASSVRLGRDAWDQRVRMRRAEFELEGTVMGIVGFGGTGRAVARRAAAFGMSCRAVDCLQVPGSDEVSAVEPVAALPELLSASDVVCICCPLTRETRDLFGVEAFGHMKETALLLNVSRGEIVDGDALVAALQGGQIGGAGLDVVPGEPLPPDHPLWELPNVVMTPHTAGASQHRAGRNLARFRRNLERLRAGEPLEGIVDKQAGF